MEQDLQPNKIYKAIKVVRILTWIAFIVLAFLVVYYKFDDCNVCKFDVKGKNLNGKGFMNLYSDECLNRDELPKINLSSLVTPD